MISKWRFLFEQFNRRLWTRALRYGVAGIAAALLSGWLGPELPLGNVDWLGAGAVQSLLTIMASSMLAVATFSLSIMVSAYAAASSSTTPRASTLLIEDPTAQRALSTFIGAFLFSIVGLIALATDTYGDSARAMLFLATIAMICFVVATMLRWIDLLVHFGRVANTIDRLENVTRRALRARVEAPYLGGARAVAIPAGARPVFAKTVGYVRHVDVARLMHWTDDGRRPIHVALLPGTFADPARPLAWIAGEADEAREAAVVAAFTIGGSRTFEQDPRFGLVVLAEIALRALSPAVNDPGTAIDVIGTVSRLLCEMVQATTDVDVGEPPFPAVHVPVLSAEDLLGDVFHPVARDGAAMLEVALTLQRALRALQMLPNREFAAVARQHASLLLERATQTMTLKRDVTTLRAAVEGL